MQTHEALTEEEHEHDSKRFKRTYVACLNCRVRKVKCDLGPASSPRDRCVRCARERRDCVFVDLKKRKLSKVRGNTFENGGLGPENVLPLPGAAGIMGPNPTTAINQQPPEHAKELENGPKHFSTMEGALVFLANAAGKIATADERDNIDAREKHSQLEGRHGQIPQNNQGDVLVAAILGNTSSSNSSNNSQGPDSHTGATSGPLSYKPYGPNLANAEPLTAPSPGPNFGPGLIPDSRSSVASSGAATPTPTATGGTDQPPAYLRPHIPTYTTSRHPLENRLTMPPAENAYSSRPEGSSALDEIEYIGPHGILTAAEAEYLIEVFFVTMHPFFPHIPRFLHLPRALSGYPILLCAILTISSRYHLLENRDHAGIAKNIEIHDRLWLYVQRLISQTVWAEASTRSIGTVFAFLLFTEWNPRAIHWRWSDYANRAEDASDNKDTDTISATAEPAGLGAMRRSYRMAWMLIGSAVRLAQDTGFMELSAKTFLATHVAEINSVMNMKRRSMLSQSLAELDLDTPDISETELETREGNEIKVLGISEDMSFPENNLQFTEAQKAQIELLQITSVGHESLYGYKAQLGSLSQRQNLSILNFMHPMISSWSRKYKKFLVPSKSKLARKLNPDSFKGSDPRATQGLASGIENESFIFEFNYTKLYIYSLALSPSPKTKDDSKPGKVSLKLDEISKSAKYIEQAFNAAHEMLQVAHRVHRLKMLRFMPVRWVTRIVRAVAFMVKCYLTITAHKTAEVSTDPSANMDHFDATILSLSLISVDEIVQSIQKAAITLRDCSPDELHLCTRYSNVLLYLYSEMKATQKNFSSNAGEDVDDLASREPQQNQQNQQHQQHQQHQQNQNQNSQSAHVHVPEAVDHNTDRTNFNENFREFDNGLSGDSEVIDWFINNRNVGLDFVGPWTELIEQHIEENNLNMDDQLNFG